jgi:hypothetical protein
MRARAAIVLALLLASVAGCGSTDHSGRDYVQAINRAQTGLVKRFTTLQAKVTPTSSAAQDRQTLLAYEAAVRKTVTDLRAVQPPSGLDALHRQFIAEVGAYGTALRTTRGELRSENAQAILAAQGRLRTAVARTGTRLNATIAAINRKLQG